MLGLFQHIIKYLNHGFNVSAIILSFAFLNICIYGQELEPRLLSNIPTGTNYVGFAYSYAGGNLLMDPSLPIEDLKAKLNTVVGSYVHSFNFFGKSAKVDAIIPWAQGSWNGYYDGVNTSTSRMGLADPRLRLSINLIGAPAVNPDKYSEYKQKTIVGISFQIIDPIGKYYSGKLINIGSNRWVLRSQLGFSHKTGRWLYEGYVGLWLFGHNPDFVSGNRLTQKPLLTSKIHIIHSLKNGMWIGIGIGYGYGGRTALNGEQRNFTISTFRLQAVLAIPIKDVHTIKFRYETGIRVQEGPDFDAITIAYQYRWNPHVKKQKKLKQKEQLSTEDEFYTII